MTIRGIVNDREKTELSYTADGNVIWYSDFGKLTVSYKVKHIPTVWSSHFIPRCLPKKAYIHVKHCINTWLPKAFLLVIVQNSKQSNYSPISELVNKMWYVYMRNALLCAWSLSRVQLCDAMNCSPPGSSVYGDSLGKKTGLDCYALLQGDLPNLGIECIAGGFFTSWPTREAREECYLATKNNELFVHSVNESQNH